MLVGYTLLLLLMVSEVGSARNIQIGLMAQLDCCSWMSTVDQGSAMTIAYRDLQTAAILNDVNITIVKRHTMDVPDGVGHVAELVREENVDVIFGSPSSAIVLPSAYLTSYWNVPHISWVAAISELSDKSMFSTFVRSLGSYSEVGDSFVHIFRQFGWNKVGLLYEDSSICAGDGIKTSFHAANITVMQSVGYTRDMWTDPLVNSALSLVQKISRVIVVCFDVPLVRQVMLRACHYGMCNGEYIFVMPDYRLPRNYETVQSWHVGDGNDEQAKFAYRYLLVVSLATWYDEAGKQRLLSFEEDVIDQMSEPPWNDDTARTRNLTANVWAQYLYDAMYFYGLWVNHTIETGHDVRDGRAMFDFTSSIEFQGVSGPCKFDGNGDRVPFYWIWQHTRTDGYPRIAAIVDTRNESQVVKTNGWSGFQWQTADGNPPADTPVCGFFNELCPAVEYDNTTLVLGLVVSILVALAVSAGFVYFFRKRQIETNMLKMIWKVDYTDINVGKLVMGVGSQIKMKGGMSQSRLTVGTDNTASGAILMTTVGMYKGQTVAIRELSAAPVTITRDDLVELKEMREMQHDNINPFIGACFEGPQHIILFLYCRKGSLQDILENDEIQLDTVFKNSLMFDLVKGMCYIHQSKLESHGRLKSANCLVDNRWMLKITDYGVTRFLSHHDHVDTTDFNEHAQYKSMLWTAPELLTATGNMPRNGTKQGDVYSFGIVLHEIFFRLGTFAGRSEMTVKELIKRVMSRCSPPCRPEISEEGLENRNIVRLMQLCWADNEQERPTFPFIRDFVRRNIPGINQNIVDLMLQRLEKYANNLEGLVDQRTHELMEEKQKTDMLLYSMMPASCADRLKMGETILPELYDSATIFFSDIVGFTEIAGKSSPNQVVDLLNDLYTHFDEIISRHDAYKVETIGDAYLVVSGIPNRNNDLHAGVIANMSMEILHGLAGFKVRHLPSQRLLIRIGMHTGACCAGVVGLSMPRYCLFGDTVNTASRMESYGQKQRIHMSEATCQALQKLGGYSVSYRGELEIKGKGLMRTYWLDGTSISNNQLPNFVE